LKQSRLYTWGTVISTSHMLRLRALLLPSRFTPSPRETEMWNVVPKRSKAKPGLRLLPLLSSPFCDSLIACGQRQLVANYRTMHLSSWGW